MAMETAVTGHAAPLSHRRVKRRFYIGAGVFAISISVVGFGPSIIDQSGRIGPLTPLVIAHAIVTGAWLLLFLSQATLIGTKRIALHRRLGLLSPVLALVVVALGFVTVIAERRRGYDLSGDLGRALIAPGSPVLPPAAVLFPLAGFVVFGVLVAAGVWYRHRPDIHKRLMLLALTPLVTESINHLIGHLAGRLPALQGVMVGPLGSLLTILVLSASAIHDRRSERRVHPVSVWVPFGLFVWPVLLVFGMSSAAVNDFAAWLIR
jgi:hypothetical protein